MTSPEIIKQTKDLTTEQKQQLGYYFLFSTMNEDKRKILLQLIQYNPDFDMQEEQKQDTVENVKDILDKYCGSAEGVWGSEDAQDYVNNLRKDDRF